MYWHEPTEHTPDGEGFWSVATYAETLAVLRDPVTYSSVTGGDRPFGGTLLQDLPIAGQVLNMMDDPRHADPAAGQLRPDTADDPPASRTICGPAPGRCSTMSNPGCRSTSWSTSPPNCRCR